MPSYLASLLVLAVLAAPNANLADCGDIANHYAAAVGQVMKALRAYEICISSSKGRDDCAAEMQALDNAHDNFTDAVGDAKDCP